MAVGGLAGVWERACYHWPPAAAASCCCGHASCCDAALARCALTCAAPCSVAPQEQLWDGPAADAGAQPWYFGSLDLGCLQAPGLALPDGAAACGVGLDDDEIPLVNLDLGGERRCVLLGGWLCGARRWLLGRLPGARRCAGRRCLQHTLLPGDVHTR